MSHLPGCAWYLETELLSHRPPSAFAIDSVFTAQPRLPQQQWFNRRLTHRCTLTLCMCCASAYVLQTGLMPAWTWRRSSLSLGRHATHLAALPCCCLAGAAWAAFTWCALPASMNVVNQPHLLSCCLLPVFCPDCNSEKARSCSRAWDVVSALSGCVGHTLQQDP